MMYVLLGASNFVRMNKNFRLANCRSLAVSGATVSPLRNSPWIKGILEEYLEQQPRGIHVNDTLILIGGTNDIRKGVPSLTLQSDFRRLLRLCTRHFGKIVLATIPPIPFFDGDVNERIEELNRWLEDVSSLRPDLILVDCFNPFIDPSSGEPCIFFFEETYTRRRDERHLEPRTDLVHLNELGLFIMKHLLLEAAGRVS